MKLRLSQQFCSNDIGNEMHVIDHVVLLCGGYLSKQYSVVRGEKPDQFLLGEIETNTLFFTPVTMLYLMNK